MADEPRSDERFDPYAAPLAADEPRDVATAPRGGYVKWIYASVSGVAILGAAVTHIVPVDGEMYRGIDVGGRVLLIAAQIIGLVWLHGAFSVFPAAVCEEVRVTPSKAVVFNFIPCVNLYWIFAVQQKLCTAIDTVLSRAARPAEAPRLLAALAPSAHFASGLLAFTDEPQLVLAGHVVVATLWLAYMFQGDAALGSVRAALARRAAFVPDS